MKTFDVELPITGYLTVTVEAADEDDAIEKAIAADLTIDNVTEWEVAESVARGNGNYVVLRYGSATE